ncbi:MAG: glyoxalase [Bacteroidota bacterium]
MNHRDNSLLELRPKIPTIKDARATQPIEKFHHKTLRPVLKLQNELLQRAFLSYTKKYKGVFQRSSKEQQIQYIQRACQKDLRFREWMMGLIVGCFTEEEWTFYEANESELRKRITSMLIRRLVDQLVEPKLS